MKEVAHMQYTLRADLLAVLASVYHIGGYFSLDFMCCYNYW